MNSNPTLETVRQFNKANIGKVKHTVISNPKTIQDKLAWLIIYDIPWSEKYGKPLKSVCADKLLVKEYVKEKTGEDLGAKVLYVWNKVSDIDWNKLPNKFVMKVNHNSGGTIICRDKSKLNIQECISKLDLWMNTDFTFLVGFESHYHWIERKIFVEELLEDESQKDSVVDYRCWCFNGEPKYFSVNNGNGHGKISSFDIKWRPMNLYKTNGKWAKPNNLPRMIEYARKLSEDFKFVRVDFYEVNGKVYLGELTFTPGNCCFKYQGNWDTVIGNMLKI